MIKPQRPHIDVATATVSMPLQTYLSLQRYASELECATEADGASAPTAPPSAWQEAAMMALPVVQFAIGNLDPQTVRGWPWQALQRLGEKMAELLPDQSEIGIALTSFARECADTDRFRAQRLQAAEAVLAEAAAEGDKFYSDDPD
jgi:hypothetical protein